MQFSITHIYIYNICTNYNFGTSGYSTSYIVRHKRSNKKDLHLPCTCHRDQSEYIENTGGKQLHKSTTCNDIFFSYKVHDLNERFPIMYTVLQSVSTITTKSNFDYIIPELTIAVQVPTVKIINIQARI